MSSTTIEPEQITAGDTIQWSRTVNGYPASEWVLSYALASKGRVITITAGADDETHQVAVSGAVSADYPAGQYTWQAYVTKGAERFTVGRGSMEILPNFAGQTGFDGRTHAKKVLDAIEAVIENRATHDQQEYEIMGRKLVKMPVADLILLRDRYRADVGKEKNAERLAKGLGGRNRILVRI